MNRIVLMRTCVFVISVAFALVLCPAGFTGAQTSTNEQFSRKAYEHFRNGLLLDMQGNTDEAIKELIRAAQIDSGKAVILKTLGDMYVLKAKNYAVGAAVYEKYLEKNPFHERTIDIVLQIYLQSQPPRLERIENLMSMVISRGNDHPKYYATLTDVLLRQKKIEHAQNASIMFIKRTGESQEACEEVAGMFKDNSMVIEGIEFFSRYLRDNPSSVNIGIVIGRLYESRDDLAAAEKAYLEVLRKSEIAHRARLHVAEMYIKAGNIDNALDLYNGINFDDPLEIPVKLEICEQFLQQFPDVPYAKIESIVESVKDKVGLNAQVFYYLGRAQAGQKRHDEAAESYNKSLQDDPVNEIVLYYLSQSEFDRENYEGAVQAISKAIQLRSDEKAFYVSQGIIYDRMGDFEGAVAAYEAGIAVKSPNDAAQATLLNNYSYILSLHDKNLDKALEMAKMAIQAEPENSSFLDTIGWVYFKLGNLENALTNIKKAADKDPENAEITDHLGDVYHKMGEIDLAIKHWQKALENDKDNEKIKEKLHLYEK